MKTGPSRFDWNHHKSPTAMIALAHLPATRRQFTGAQNLSTGLEAIGHQNAASEILKQLRSALASLEAQIGNPDLNESRVRKQMRACEALHEESMKAVRAAIPCAQTSFKRRMSAQAALSGLCFA